MLSETLNDPNFWRDVMRAVISGIVTGIVISYLMHRTPLRKIAK